ncbi:hypothetical protein BU24DRAFT_68611 [Aaosphaeria arxii CBS 175.79]|uniref:Uncharacterized protein n=1 Tax=Aaosphaeria arxii CBS 175.79 TaxID=1450172 RepID=A0A6A5XAM9_9PLEO|nr:uncharacterized protein BU24DRAFT_68611 [Aaosphaeria arxii CBS 175.79]KAF2009970.1 hypothetical protein BU24DRAFT_68611 [Aaosphaeria arxii CBS 175.79]
MRRSFPMHRCPCPSTVMGFLRKGTSEPVADSLSLSLSLPSYCLCLCLSDSLTLPQPQTQIPPSSIKTKISASLFNIACIEL